MVDDCERARESIPRVISRVLMMGRALSGTLVSGMMPTHTTMKTDSAFGYPGVSRMLEVISSRTLLPNIRRPATAMMRSRVKVKM